MRDLKVFIVSSFIIVCACFSTEASQNEYFFCGEKANRLFKAPPSSRPLLIQDRVLESANPTNKRDASAKEGFILSSSLELPFNPSHVMSPVSIAAKSTEDVTFLHETQDSVQRQTSSKGVRRKSQKKKKSSSPSGATYSRQTRVDVKPRIRELLQTVNPFDGEGKFYSIEVISNIFQTEAMLFHRAFKPTPDDLLQIILDDPKLRQLYEKTNINR